MSDLAIRPGDWYAIGCVFTLYWFDDLPPSGPKGSAARMGCQALAAMDVGSGEFLTQASLREHGPSPISAGEVMRFVNHILRGHSKPRVGVFIGQSVWMSSVDLLFLENTRARGEWLLEHGIEFDAMSDADRAAIADYLSRFGLRAAFSEEEL